MDAGRADPTREFPPTAGEATTTLPFRGGTSATHKAHAAAAVKEAAVASAQAAGFEVVADEADAAAEAEAGEEEEVNQVCCGSGCVGAFVVCVWTFVEPPEPTGKAHALPLTCIHCVCMLVGRWEQRRRVGTQTWPRPAPSWAGTSAPLRTCRSATGRNFQLTSCDPPSTTG